jgi:LysM repeat protein
MKNCSFFVLLIFVLSACQIKKSPAPIIYNHNKSSLRSSSETIPTLSNDGEVISTSLTEDNQSEIISPTSDDDYIMPAEKPVENNFKIIYHEVQVGETIEEIALKYKQTVEEIAQLNALFPPFYLDEFQIIKIKMDKDIVKSEVPEAPKKQIIKVKKPDFIAPVSGKILTKFGEKTPYGINKGINIAAKEGTKIISATNGKVIYSDYDATFGYLVIIKVDGQNVVASYAHMEDLITAKGKTIKQGDVIGYVGNTGKVDKFQLHFGIREGKSAKDPMNFVKF